MHWANHVRPKNPPDNEGRTKKKVGSVQPFEAKESRMGKVLTIFVITLADIERLNTERPSTRNA